MNRGLGLCVAAASAWIVAAATAEPAAPDARLTLPIDFSHAGYRGGGVVLPAAPATIVVAPAPGDDGERILAALDLVGRRPPDAQGHRGVVQLLSGEYQIAGQLKLSTGGVVLRGAGTTEGGTVLAAEGVDRRALIAVNGPADDAGASGISLAVDSPVAAGATRMPLGSTQGLAVGDRVVVRRPSTEAWISRLGMDAFVGWRPEGRLNWKPGSRDIAWDRIVTAMDAGGVTLDAPITTDLDPAYGGGVVQAGASTPRLREVGIEGLKLVSRHDPQRPMDEDHSWFAIAMDRVEDSWVRDVAAEGFVSYVVDLGETSRRITVQDVSASDPVSEIGGYRRRVFYTAGQQTLFVRCESKNGIHDFGLGHAAAGPNVFLDCVSEESLGDSGALESWASGALFDGVKVRGGPLRLTHRGRDAQGAGWAAANSVLWNCEATVVEVRSPPNAANAAIGCRGERVGEGVVEDPRVEPGRDFHRAQPQAPASLYRAQLVARLGDPALAALEPAALPVPAPGVRVLTEAEVEAYRASHRPADDRHPLTLTDGEFRIDGQPAWKRRAGFSFFQAQMPTALAESYGPFITRFAPGLEGVGLTDELDAFAATLSTGDVVQHNYGLWYDRRRVDHDFYGSPDQKDGEVWAPFIELPWARSGQGRAWDGLSKYDLTRFNPWFFERVRGFAERAEQRGVVLYHRMYLQHWLLESRSHYVDFPWRPVNAIQATGMPNEVPAAETFWDVSDPVRRDLHRRYIRHTLDVLKGQGNVVIGLDPEYTGPLPFVQFWLDVIGEWENETGADVRVVLEVPKAEMDAILDDPARARRVDGVGFHHWTYRPDGALFAVEGGLNRAPREQADAIAHPEDLTNGADAAQVRRDLWRSSPAMRYRAFREYRDRRADMAVLGGEDAFPDLSRAVDASFPAGARAAMRPDAELVAPGPTTWALADGRGVGLVYAVAGGPVTMERPLDAPTRVIWAGGGSACLSAAETELTPPTDGPWAAWLKPVAACP
ncbi:DUF6298 domain-containing protein [Brevundimonas sp. PAMC22021]|uniref:DUF6298 domain-containing protein n=1 Tax=Brevundimonas sp. PAMC22021 TaxID=2861285 RepID=UPI001C636391|nr:DUF6298 domain-containing protein [Brevundimonas sp. PAMC22021]QYF88194.1 hypothetical protein KY493_06975 [Brevundimonas sp. PAMC22021]